jgi:hypothetical protein
MKFGTRKMKKIRQKDKKTKRQKDKKTIQSDVSYIFFVHKNSKKKLK